MFTQNKYISQLIKIIFINIKPTHTLAGLGWQAGRLGWRTPSPACLCARYSISIDIFVTIIYLKYTDIFLYLISAPHRRYFRFILIYYYSD